MVRVKWFLFGMASVCVSAAVAGLIVITQAHGFSARAQPTAVERWMARRARGAALPKDAKGRQNPVQNGAEVIAEARTHWADHCAACHANDGSGNTEIGRGLYPPAPDMRRAETQQLTDGELFYIIENGIRLTGMPAWGAESGHGSQEAGEDSWKLVHFIRHLPKLTPDEIKEMEGFNPKSAAEQKEQEEEEKFLKGETTNGPQTKHHPH